MAEKIMVEKVPSVPNKPGGRLLSWLDENIEKPFLFVGMATIILIITFQTAYRYFIVHFTSNAGAAVWTEELARFIFVWISYLAIPLAIKNRSNIRVDILVDRLPEKFQRITWVVVDILFLCLTSVVAYLGLMNIQNMLDYPQTTPAMQVPYMIPYLIVPIAFGLMTIRLIQDLIGQVKVTGIKHSLYGLACVGVIALPLFFSIFMEVEFNSLILLFGYFLVLMLIGVPIAISLGLSSLATIIGAGTLPIDYVAQTAFTSIDSFPIMAIPFFIAAGVFMGAGGLSARLLKLADQVLGSFPGGIALASIATCMFFAAISGSGPATVAAIGSITIPAMIERGYDKYFSAVIVACAGAIGVMIPPSNPFVVYGISAQVSIGKLFIGGIVPGIMTGGALMLFSYYYCKKKGWKGDSQTRNISSFFRALLDAKYALMVPVIILGGIYGGLMTPTEAAAVAAFYGLFVGLFVYRELNLGNITSVFIEACSTSAIVIILMAMATIFGNIMAIEEVPNRIAAAILGFTDSKIVILILINVLLLAVGTFMEALAAIVILTPILLPIVLKVGVDPIHFGIMMVVNLAIGFVTPPVGVNLFVASGIAKIKIEQMSKAAVPLIAIMIGILLLITYIPWFSLVLN